MNSVDTGLKTEKSLYAQTQGWDFQGKDGDLPASGAVGNESIVS